jgi:hypothetical protein
MKAKNIQKIINWIKKDQGKHLKMQVFCAHLDHLDVEPNKYVECKTAFCVAGYANLLRLQEEGAEPLSVESTEEESLKFSKQFNSEAKAAEWMGIEDKDYNNLFYVENAPISREYFDELKDSDRAKIIIAVLRHLIVSGDINWHVVNWADYTPKQRS